MKLGYVVLKMAVDVYIICEYEKDGEMYNYRDLIKIQHNGNVINNIQLDGNPKLQRMHEDWWRKNNSIDDIKPLLREALIYVLENKRVVIGKIE